MKTTLNTLLFAIMICTSPLFAQQLDIQGHRGARGMRPENTIPAFIYAMDHDVTTVELDVVITKDSQVVVSHDAYMESTFCLKPDGSAISPSEEKGLNIYQMTYEEVRQYDCGSKSNDRFEQQESVATPKPLLADVIKAVEKHVKGVTHYEVDYNIEIKSTPSGEGKYHPEYKEYSDLVYNLIDQYLPWSRVVIQSFDFRVLRYWHEKHPEVRLAALVENTRSIKSNLASLGFKPHIYSPYYRLLSKKKIEALHDKDIKVIPWTVNKPEKMQQLVRFGVDGLITDYPNTAKELGLTPHSTGEDR